MKTRVICIYKESLFYKDPDREGKETTICKTAELPSAIISNPEAEIRVNMPEREDGSQSYIMFPMRVAEARETPSGTFDIVISYKRLITETEESAKDEEGKKMVRRAETLARRADKNKSGWELVSEKPIPPGESVLKYAPINRKPYGKKPYGKKPYGRI